MKEVAKLQIKDRMELFQATAISMGMQPNVIEKDFWVCFMLDHLFHDCKYKNAFVFKGGTSLSKSYHVIERFSEDIDLILDWRKIMNDEVNPWEERSKTKQDLFNKQINSEAAKFYKEELIPQLNSEMKEKLGDGEWMPSHETIVTPFAAEKYPDIFSQKDTSVLTIDVERTFWEKLTILHKIANFPEGKPLPARYARHLYDVYNMGNSWVKERAFKRKELLEKDVVFKQKFYYVKGAHYETATLSSIELLPKEAVLNALKEDYQAMRNMIYGNIPEFEEILEFLEKLQEEVHGLVVT
jgi:predicted nucleotidyltransferase component of viral defense system